jgi:hypothetical protein
VTHVPSGASWWAVGFRRVVDDVRPKEPVEGT